MVLFSEEGGYGKWPVPWSKKGWLNTHRYSSYWTERKNHRQYSKSTSNQEILPGRWCSVLLCRTQRVGIIGFASTVHTVRVAVFVCPLQTSHQARQTTTQSCALYIPSPLHPLVIPEYNLKQSITPHPQPISVNSEVGSATTCCWFNSALWLISPINKAIIIIAVIALTPGYWSNRDLQSTNDTLCLAVV